MLYELKAIEQEYNRMKDEEKRLNEIIDMRDKEIRKLREDIKRVRGELYSTNRGCKTILTLIEVERKHNKTIKTFLDKLQDVAYRTRAKALKAYTSTGEQTWQK